MRFNFKVLLNVPNKKSSNTGSLGENLSRVSFKMYFVHDIKGRGKILKLKFFWSRVNNG